MRLACPSRESMCLMPYCTYKTRCVVCVRVRPPEERFQSEGSNCALPEAPATHSVLGAPPERISMQRLPGR